MHVQCRAVFANRCEEQFGWRASASLRRSLGEHVPRKRYCRVLKLAIEHAANWKLRFEKRPDKRTSLARCQRPSQLVLTVHKEPALTHSRHIRAVHYDEQLAVT